MSGTLWCPLISDRRFGGTASEPLRMFLSHGNCKRAAPIFPVSDLQVSLNYYRRLGFTVREYEGGGYGFANRDGIEIHLGTTSTPTAGGAKHSAYLWVDNSDALAHEWRSVGAEVHMPEDTAWGQHEGAVVDPDGNVLRFGSPLD